MAATTVETNFYKGLPADGLSVTGYGAQWFYAYLTDTDIGGDLAEAGDKIRVFKINKNNALLNAFTVPGDHDTATAFLYDLVGEGAIEGAASAAHNLIDASSSAQAGEAIDWAGAGTSPSIEGVLGRRISTSGFEIYLQCDTAPTGATATRSFLVAVLIANAAP